MKHLLKKGEIKELIPESGGGISGEVYLVVYKSKKYILRKCNSISTAIRYQDIAKTLDKYNILPRFLGRYGKNVFFEFIEGRDLTKDEKPEIFRQVGKIVAIISRLKTKKPDNDFFRQLKELKTGKYKKNLKIDIKRYRERLDKRRIKPLFGKDKYNQIKSLYSLLYNKNNPKIVLDANDVVPNNFRLRKNRVYYVDIEGIKPRIKGFGIAKCFLKWAKEENQQKVFRKGYEKIDKWFFEGSYADLCYIRFLIQALNYKCQIGRNYRKDLRNLNRILNKYTKPS